MERLTRLDAFQERTLAQLATTQLRVRAQKTPTAGGCGKKQHYGNGSTGTNENATSSITLAALVRRPCARMMAAEALCKVRRDSRTERKHMFAKGPALRPPRVGAQVGPRAATLCRALRTCLRFGLAPSTLASARSTHTHKMKRVRPEIMAAPTQTISQSFPAMSGSQGTPSSTHIRLSTSSTFLRAGRLPG